MSYKILPHFPEGSQLTCHLSLTRMTGAPLHHKHNHTRALCLHFASFSLPVVAKESLDEDAAEAGDEEGRGGEEGEREQGSHHLQSGNS